LDVGGEGGAKKYIYYILTYTIEYLHIYIIIHAEAISLHIAANWVFVFPNGKLMEEVKHAEYGCRVLLEKYYPNPKEKIQ
jgi:hypothetical protein